MKINSVIATCCVVFLQLQSCNKFLDKKSDKQLAIPSSLQDLQSLLDTHNQMNELGFDLLELIADNYEVASDFWQSRDDGQRFNYNWDPNAEHYNTWAGSYKVIYNANVVLDNLSKINYSVQEQDDYNNIKGSALFFRSFNFFQLAQLYCRPYTNNAKTDLGLPIRLTAAIESPSVRSTVQETYDQIINDFKIAADLLPVKSLFPTRPSKSAAYGALARTYLAMRDYENAGLYANLCLELYSELLNFNELSPGYIPRFNKETIFYSHGSGQNIMHRSRAIIDSVLYNSYQENDLRKSVLFSNNTDGTHGFWGCYDGDYVNWVVFDGITTGEIYLIRAEAFARKGEKEKALADLNTLLKARWKTGAFLDFTAMSASQALDIILAERRKELIYRGLRWSDLRRFNLEGAQITLTRVIYGTTYNLTPEDPRWVLLIPKYVIEHSGIVQNPR